MAGRIAAAGDRRGASEEERNPLTAPEEAEESGLDGEWDPALSENAADGRGRGRGGRRNATEAYKSAAHLSVEQKLAQYKWMVLGLAGCACCLTVVVVVGVVLAAKGPPHRRHRSVVTLSMMEEVKQLEAAAGGLGVASVALRHQDDLCTGGTAVRGGVSFFDHLLAQECTHKGGICVENEDACSNAIIGTAGEGGVIKGTCGSGCGCCFAGCPPKWIGDGECDFACNTEEHHWDGNDCRGAAPLFSECPAAWLGDGECDDLCNNARNRFDGGDCMSVADTAPAVPIEHDPNGDGIAGNVSEVIAGAFHVCPSDWIGDGECDAVCNTTRYNFDCTTPRAGNDPFCDCKQDDVRGVPDEMPAAGDANANCPAEARMELFADHCESVGGRCTGKGAHCNGVIRGKCGPDCFCCIGRDCDARHPLDRDSGCTPDHNLLDLQCEGELKYVGDGICDTDCNTEQFQFDGGDCKGDNPAAYSAQESSCPPDWKSDGECDVECSFPANEWDGGDCEDEECHGEAGCMPANVCPSAWKGDRECDAACNNAHHEWDRGDCNCVDQHTMCAAKVAQGSWSCENLLCETCPKPRLCQLTCAGHGNTRHCDPDTTRQELQGGGGHDSGQSHSPQERARQTQLEQRAAQTQCPDAILNPSPLTVHCAQSGGVCMENKGDCMQNGTPGLIKGNCGSACGCCHINLAAACQKFAGDGQCDPVCNTEEYGYDGAQMEAETEGKGDCSSDAQFQACPQAWVGDGECDPPCNNEENDYDYPDCTPSVQGDDECDDVCNNELHNWDGLDGSERHDCRTPTEIMHNAQTAHMASQANANQARNHPTQPNRPVNANSNGSPRRVPQRSSLWNSHGGSGGGSASGRSRGSGGGAGAGRSQGSGGGVMGGG